jgi:hypothetical protein
MADQITKAFYLDIEGVALATPAYWITDLLPLLDAADVRGRDRLLPSAAGFKAYRRRETLSLRKVDLFVDGRKDREGNAHANFTTGLVTNIRYLVANVFAPVGSGDGLVTATIHKPDSSTLTAEVHVEGGGGFEWVDGYTARGSLILSIPAGKFT